MPGRGPDCRSNCRLQSKSRQHTQQLAWAMTLLCLFAPFSAKATTAAIGSSPFREGSTADTVTSASPATQGASAQINCADPADCAAQCSTQNLYQATAGGNTLTDANIQQLVSLRHSLLCCWLLQPLLQRWLTHERLFAALSVRKRHANGTRGLCVGHQLCLQLERLPQHDHHPKTGPASRVADPCTGCRRPL